MACQASGSDGDVVTAHPGTLRPPIYCKTADHSALGLLVLAGCGMVYQQPGGRRPGTHRRQRCDLAWRSDEQQRSARHAARAQCAARQLT